MVLMTCCEKSPTRPAAANTVVLFSWKYQLVAWWFKTRVAPLGWYTNLMLGVDGVQEVAEGSAEFSGGLDEISAETAM